MTQQPERCGHYDACWFVHIWGRCPNDEPTEYETDLPDCELDTRTSRPAPASDEMAFKDSIIEQQKIHIKVLNEKMVEMMHGAAAKAREDVLDELAKEIDRVSKTWHHACALHEIVKSLRHREVQG